MSKDVLGVPLPLPKPALTYEDMWFQVKAYLASMVMDRKTPQAIFNVRELMGELERERIAPMAHYIQNRKEIEGGQASSNAPRRSRFRASGTGKRVVLALGKEAQSTDGGRVSA